jgi:hypothetical protein
MDERAKKSAEGHGAKSQLKFESQETGISAEGQEF